MADYEDIEVTQTGHVALIEIQRPPHKVFQREFVIDAGDKL